MEGPFVSRRSYMYGNTFFEMEMPYYNSTRHHHDFRKPPMRNFPLPTYDDGSEYLEDSTDGVVNIGIARPDPKYMILDIETEIIKKVRVRLYGAKEEDDKEVILEIGKRYAITYMTQYGIKTLDGYLRYIDNSIPDECTRYIGSYSNTTSQAFIGMDCSTKGISDKRKIYIDCIRGIEELADDADYVPPVDESNTSHTLYEILSNLNKAIADLSALNESDICSQVLSGIQDIKTKVEMQLYLKLMS